VTHVHLATSVHLVQRSPHIVKTSSLLCSGSG
jgi:hypothetical protein